MEKTKSFFGKVDRRRQEEDTDIVSEFPAWMQEHQIMELDEEISGLERDLEHNMIPESDRHETRTVLKDLKERFDEIVVSKPNFDLTERKRLEQNLEKLNLEVGDSLYSRYEMKKGLGKIHKEADLNDFPCIPIDKEIVDLCNLTNYVNGKVPRNQADKARKILCKYFNRDDDSREAIRRENYVGSKNRIAFTNTRMKQRYEEIFNKKEDESKEEINDRLDNIKEKLNKLEGSKEPKEIKYWNCPECSETVSTRKKGTHIAAHRRAEIKAKESIKEKQLIEV